jgi:hypothetical protein
MLSIIDSSQCGSSFTALEPGLLVCERTAIPTIVGNVLALDRLANLFTDKHAGDQRKRNRDG